MISIKYNKFEKDKLNLKSNCRYKILPRFFLTFIHLLKMFYKLYLSSDDDNCWLMQSMYFQSLNSHILVCVSPNLPLILKKKEKNFFVNSLQEAGCICFASSGSLLLSQSFPWNLLINIIISLNLFILGRCLPRLEIETSFCLTF